MPIEENIHSFELGFIMDQTKRKLLERLRSSEPFDKDAWVLRDMASGKVLATRIAGVIDIDQEVCERVLGEPV